MTRTFLAGTDLDALIADESVLLDGNAVAMDVGFGKKGEAACCQMVGVPTPEGHYRLYLTNLPPSVGPRQVVDLYRVRWEIEIDNKVNKSALHLDAIRARTGATVRAMVHASMIGSIMTCILVHHHRIDEAPPPKAHAPRKTAPLHPQLFALAIASASGSIASAMQMSGIAAEQEWQRLAQLFVHLAKDPNWSSRPSIQDQLRGWAIASGRPRKARLASAPSRNTN